MAVALAIVGWAYFRLAGNPTSATPPYQQLSIPISTVNLPLGYVARFAEQEAVVTVATKPGESAVQPEEVRAVLDLSNKQPGIYNVPVQLVARNVVVQSLSPASIALSIERIEQRTFPITVRYVGARPSGIVVSYTSIGPDSAVVRAPTSVLAQVTSVHADVPLPGAPKEIDEMVRPVAVDASGNGLPGLSVTPNLVRVQMRVVAGTGTAR